MLLIETLRNKPGFVKNGENIIDLTAQSVSFDRGSFFVSGVSVIDSDFEMRPDLISKVYFSNINKLDYILKYNGVSNPFSIETGDILLIPNEEDMKLAFKSKKQTSTSSPDSVAKKFFDPNRLSKKDQKRLDYLKEKSAQLSNGSKNNLPPNFAEPGAKELTVKDGKVIFGNDVAGSKENCPDPLSKARAKAKLLENKIFKNTR